MGGNALKVETIRLNQKEYVDLTIEVLDKLSKYYDYIDVVGTWFEKDSFGDLDLIVKKPKIENIKEILIQEFKSKDVFINSDVVSFEYNNFQVDLIHSNNPKSTLFYMCYGDLNHIIGKIAHKFGLKFGMDGLYYPLRTEHGNVSKEIFLTDVPSKIYEFLGYSFNRYSSGFNTKKDIFDFIVSSRYFSTEVFLKEDLSQIDKRYIKKRPMYVEFIDYLKTNIIENNYCFNKDKSTYLTLIDSFFDKSNLLKEYELFIKQQQELKIINTKFNGKIIMEMFPEIQGKTLGTFITIFKQKFNHNELLNMDKDEIKNQIKIEYNYFKKGK